MWTSSYSNEDFDRTQRLAVELSPTGSIGYTKDAFARAEKIVNAANRYHRTFTESVTY